MTTALRAPFPWFGGKSRAAHLIWERFGDVANYIEPFAGSLAVLLARPTPPRIETVNDLDCMVANFWRATQADPEAVAKFADWPVNEADLHARHRWLVAQIPTHRERTKTDPDYFDAKIAGWWVWGLCQWIGTGWCIDRGASGDGQRGYGDSRTDKPPPASIPIQLPHLGSAGRGPLAVLTELAERLRRVRVACGDWSRVLGGSVTWRLGITGIVLDPPYAEGNMEYATGVSGVSAEVGAWARENGDHALLRIAVCGLDGEHDLPGWLCVPWKANGGYGSQRRDGSNDNAKRERIWFSPHCLRPHKGQMLMPGVVPA